MSAVDRLGREIYHTNVFLSVGAVVVVVCLEAVLEGEREELQASLARHGRHILVISQQQVTSLIVKRSICLPVCLQVESMAGNCYEVRDRLVISSKGWASLTLQQQQLVTQAGLLPLICQVRQHLYRQFY